MAFQAFQERLRQVFRRAKFDGGAVSRSAPVVEVTQTWNSSGTTFVGSKTNIINIGSTSYSLIRDWQVNNVSVASIRKDGAIGSNNAWWLGYSVNGHPAFGYFRADDGNPRAVISPNNLILAADAKFSWTATNANANGSADTVFTRISAGVTQIQNDLKLRNLIGTGNLATGAVAKSADYTATTSDGTIEVDASGAACTITLFAASGNAGKIIVVKKTDSSANAVTVDANASETIDGATTISLASQYSTVILQVNAAGTGWNKLGGV